MYLLVIDGNEEPRSPDNSWGYETKRLLQEASHFSSIKKIECEKVECLDTSKLSSIPDLVIARSISALHERHWPEILYFMEERGALCMNSADSVFCTANKITMGNKLQAWNIPYPATIPLQTERDFENAGQKLGFPLIVKQGYGSQGKGVVKCDSPEAFRNATAAFYDKDSANPLLAQRYVDSSYGRDVRAFVVGEHVLASMLRQAKEPGEFRSNFTLGGNVEPIALSAKDQQLAVDATRAVGLNYAGVDLLFVQNGYVVCEVNKTPGFEGLERAFPNLNAARAIIAHGVQLTQEFGRKTRPSLGTCNAA